MNEIKAFFNPKSVAVVGVSADPGKIGSIIFNNMLDAGFKGELYPVNPKHDELFWHKCYPSLLEIEADVDLAVIVVPTEHVLQVIQDAGQKAVKSVIIITAGFKEIGAEGGQLEQQILNLAKSFGIRIIGPNCLGIIAPKNGVNASFAASTPKLGNIAFLSQSGAYCTAILDMALPINLGFSHMVSFGNKADVDEIDILKMLLIDDEVKVVGAYLEEVKFGQQFCKTINEAEVRKPIIVLKAGQSEEAKKAIISHTGSIAGSSKTFQTAMQQLGVIEAYSSRDLFNLMLAFSWSKMPQGPRVGIITNAGGPGIVATDLIMQSGLQMAQITESSRQKLAKALPFTANLHNPIDIVGDAQADRYQVAVQTLAEDENVDAILIIITPQLITQIEETAKIIINAIKFHDKPIIPILLGEKYMGPALTRFYDNQFPAYKDIKDAVDVLSEMVKFSQFKPLYDEEFLQFKNQGQHSEKLKAFLGQEQALNAELTSLLAEEVGLDLPAQQMCNSLDSAKAFADGRYPVVIKAANSDIAHKTDFKAVYVDLVDEKALGAAYTVLEQTIKDKTGLTSIEILVQEQIKYEQELFIGANRDGDSNVYSKQGNGFGHLLVFGQGGIYSEIYQDFGYALSPTSTANIIQQLHKTKVSKILRGARGKMPLAISKYIEAIMAVQKLILLYPEIKSLDINPILLTQSRAVAVDIKIFV